MELKENMVVADRFRLSRMIGRGGMGSVWQAVQVGLDRPCAVKFIEGELANVAEAHARFEREAKAAAQLHSPHVVQIYDHGVWQGTPYIAMELLDGEDLGKRLQKEGGRLAAAQVNVVIQQVCRALTKAHAAGVVHRDLKPDNIFLVRDDDREIVKILDFGVAKSTAQAIDGSNTKTGAMLGTPYYMSPEQAQGIKSVDARSDLWSLGVIVFQCMTGRLPFESEALGDLLVKIIVPAPLPVPSQLVEGLPPMFDTWWEKAGERNPDNRYQTAREFAESLELHLGTSSVTMVTDKFSGRVGGATALMAPGAAPVPRPGSQTKALLNTPNPAAIPPPHPPHMSTPHPAVGHASTGSPVVGTLPGFDGTGLPKQNPPVALFAGIGAIALVGLALGGYALFGRGSKATADTTTTATASVAAATTPPKEPPPPEPPPSPPPATAAAPADAPAATVAHNTTPDRPAAKATAPTVKGSSKTSAAPATTTTGKTATAPPAKASATAPSKGLNLGF